MVPQYKQLLPVFPFIAILPSRFKLFQLKKKNHSLSFDLVQLLVNPKNNIDPSTIYQGNRFKLKRLPLLIYLQTICLGVDLHILFCKERKTSTWYKNLLWVLMQVTEKSEFSSIVVLDETADIQEIGSQVLNILIEKCHVGHTC